MTTPPAGHPAPSPDIAHDIALVDSATAALHETAARLTDEDVAGPSLCDGWTRGHVLTHLARNAEAISRLAQWAATGEPQEMYPGGTERRDADIEAGAGRVAAELLADLRGTADDLAEVLPALLDGLATAEVEMRGGYLVASERLPFLRLREVVLHHVDLDAGYTLADVDGAVLVRLIDDAVSRLRLSHRAPSVTLRTPEGETWTVGDGEVEVTGPRHGLLLWLSRRIGSGVSSSSGDLPALPRGA
jgi:maleylpyruvate isomerase